MREHEPLNILMVDDQPDKLLTYEVILSELGENLIKAGSAREALAYLLQIDPIPIVLLDVHMPELDGFALADLIRHTPATSTPPFSSSLLHTSPLSISSRDIPAAGWTT
jgi:CheY-like chemotaxis protein